MNFNIHNAVIGTVALTGIVALTLAVGIFVGAYLLVDIISEKVGNWFRVTVITIFFLTLIFIAMGYS